jgi:hypothetical protein
MGVFVTGANGAIAGSSQSIERGHEMREIAAIDAFADRERIR